MSSKDMTEILPCPWCGKPGKLIDDGIEETGYKAVVCSDGNCGGTCFMNTESEAIAAWNRRAPDPLRQDVVEAAERWERTYIGPCNDTESMMARQNLQEKLMVLRRAEDGGKK